MSEVLIRNPEILKTLNSFKDDMFSTPEYNHPKHFTFREEADKENGDYFCSNTYLDDCLSRGQEGLVGAPDRYFASPISKMVREDKDNWSDYMNRVKYEFAAELGAHTSALLSYYPPGGFVGWHTNWDASAYQILFTWSAGGGYFRYRDPKSKKIVTIKDVEGWQCRHYYFGAKDEPEHHLWHSAYAEGERLTLAYKFVNGGGKHNVEKDRQAQELRDMLIDDIEYNGAST